MNCTELNQDIEKLIKEVDATSRSLRNAASDPEKAASEVRQNMRNTDTLADDILEKYSENFEEKFPNYFGSKIEEMESPGPNSFATSIYQVDDNHMVAGGTDMPLILYERDEDSQWKIESIIADSIQDCKGNASNISEIHPLPDGSGALVIGNDRGALYLLDNQTKTLSKRIAVHISISQGLSEDRIKNVQDISEKQIIVSCENSAHFYQKDEQGKWFLSSWTAVKAPIKEQFLSSDGNELLIADSSNTIYVLSNNSENLWKISDFFDVGELWGFKQVQETGDLIIKRLDGSFSLSKDEKGNYRIKEPIPNTNSQSAVVSMKTFKDGSVCFIDKDGHFKHAARNKKTGKWETINAIDDKSFNDSQYKLEVSEEELILFDQFDAASFPYRKNKNGQWESGEPIKAPVYDGKERKITNIKPLPDEQLLLVKDDSGNHYIYAKNADEKWECLQHLEDMPRTSYLTTAIGGNIIGRGYLEQSIVTFSLSKDKTGKWNYKAIKEGEYRCLDSNGKYLLFSDNGNSFLYRKQPKASAKTIRENLDSII